MEGVGRLTAEVAPTGGATRLTLLSSDGSVLVTSGSFLAAGGATPNNQVPQVWRNGAWTSIASFG